MLGLDVICVFAAVLEAAPPVPDAIVSAPAEEVAEVPEPVAEPVVNEPVEEAKAKVPIMIVTDVVRPEMFTHCVYLCRPLLMLQSG